MNIFGIYVSQGESYAALIRAEREKISFKFKHKKSGLKELNPYIDSKTIIIFETTGVYLTQLTNYLRTIKAKFYELNPLEVKLR